MSCFLDWQTVGQVIQALAKAGSLDSIPGGCQTFYCEQLGLPKTDEKGRRGALNTEVDRRLVPLKGLFEKLPVDRRQAFTSKSGAVTFRKVR